MWGRRAPPAHISPYPALGALSATPERSHRTPSRSPAKAAPPAMRLPVPEDQARAEAAVREIVRDIHKGLDIVVVVCLTLSCSVLRCSSAEEVEEEGHAKPPSHLVHASRPIPWLLVNDPVGQTP